jgi:DNA-3-methyladenine glycosylase
VTEADGYPAAVLVRALEPVAGLDEMARRRSVANPRLLCAGPGRLCQALGITGAQNARPLQSAPIRILRAHGGAARPRIATSPRIGITKATDWPLRFCIRNSPWLSRKV